MKIYDAAKKRVIEYDLKRSDPEHWHTRWGDDTKSIAKRITEWSGDKLVMKKIRELLPSGARILEGGCGIGQKVYALDQLGYEAYGVDFVKRSIDATKALFPHLRVSHQDVRHLDFPDNFFDGYWSLGIIEHFWDGYEGVMREMARVIKPKGYSFVTFPRMSPLRKLKAKLGGYTYFNPSMHSERDFYQFLLDAEKVKTDMTNLGFTCVYQHSDGAVKGIKDEITILKPVLQPLFSSSHIVARLIKFAIGRTCSRIAGHHTVLIFCKTKETAVS